MRRLLLALIGVAILASAVILLWTARGPVSTNEITTGTALEPMAVAADEGEFALELEESDEALDTGAAPLDAPGNAAPGAAAPEISSAGDDMFGLAEAVPLTSDLMLNEDMAIEIEPVDPLEARAEAEESRGGPVVPAAFEQRVVEMEWPSQFRVGGSGTVRVKLKMLDDGSVQPVAQFADNEISASPIMIADNYTTHNAQLTATISAPDFEIEALNPETQTLLRGGEAQWLWTLVADNSGRGVIAVGLTLTWVSKATGNPETTVSLWGQALEADINYVFGSITVPQASIAGTLLAVVGFVAQIPLIDAILEVISRIFFGGRRSSKARSRK